MKGILLLIVATFCLYSCKKVKEEIIEDAALSFIDGTEWKIVAFSEGSNNQDVAFAPYRFRFNQNETVSAIKNNSIEATGAWKGNIVTRTIQAKFDANAGFPLPLLNTTWTITKSTSTTLSATATVSGSVRKLRMEKL